MTDHCGVDSKGRIHHSRVIFNTNPARESTTDHSKPRVVRPIARRLRRKTANAAIAVAVQLSGQ